MDARYLLITILLTSVVSASGANEADGLEALFNERVESIGIVELVIQNEESRDRRTGTGVVIDDEGRILLLDSIIPAWVATDRLTDFRVFKPGSAEDGIPASYLGVDYLSGAHLVQVDAPSVQKFRPVSDFESGIPVIGRELWGMGFNGKEWNYEPYLLTSSVSAVLALPQKIAITQQPVGGPGALAFDREGRLAGWVQEPFSRTFQMRTSRRTESVQLLNISQSTVVLSLSDWFSDLDGIVARVCGGSRPWLGIAGLQALDTEVADFLELESSGAVVVSDVITGSPAEGSGLLARDIITHVGGEPIPDFVPRYVATRWFDREVLRREPGGRLDLRVLRENAPVEIEVELGDAPREVREAEWIYFERLGFTIREFMMEDALRRRILEEQESGPIVTFTNANKPASSAGLRPNDWLREVDSRPVNSFVDAKAFLVAAENDSGRSELVLLIERDNETQVLRLKLD